MEQDKKKNSTNNYLRQKAVQKIDDVLGVLNKDVIQAEREREHLYFITADIFGQVRLEDWEIQAKLIISNLEEVKCALLRIKFEDEFICDSSRK